MRIIGYKTGISRNKLKDYRLKWNGKQHKAIRKILGIGKRKK